MTTRFKNSKLNKNDPWRKRYFWANIIRFILTPIYLIMRIYFWVWDYDFYERFKRGY